MGSSSNSMGSSSKSMGSSNSMGSSSKSMGSSSNSMGSPFERIASISSWSKLRSPFPSSDLSSRRVLFSTCSTTITNSTGGSVPQSHSRASLLRSLKDSLHPDSTTMEGYLRLFNLTNPSG